MNRIYTILLVAALSAVPFAGIKAGNDVPKAVKEQLIERDSILIGDQIRYGVTFVVPEGTGVSIATDSLSSGIEVLGGGITLDTLKSRRGKLDMRASMLVTSFEEGEYPLPEFTVALAFPDGTSDTLRYSRDTMSVRTIPIDTATFQLNPLKAQIGYPVTFKEVVPWIAGVIVLALLVVSGIYLFRRRGAKADTRKPSEPPHITALRKLDAYRGTKLWEPAKQKQFYTGVTDAVREYIAARYAVPAMEMTTGEIFAALKDELKDSQTAVELRSLFERSDYVKFAKYVASEQENSSAVPVAVRFINETYQNEIETKEGRKS